MRGQEDLLGVLELPAQRLLEPAAGCVLRKPPLVLLQDLDKGLSIIFQIYNRLADKN